MQSATAVSVYEEIGVKPVINARGFNTVVGGNNPSPRAKQAMEQVERYYVDMQELLEKSGQIVARLMGAEAAYVTPGAAAALALGTAACVTGDDLDKMARLPDTTGMKSQTVIQRCQIYPYDRAVTIVGTRLVEVGDERGTTAAQFEAALGPDVANVLYPAHLDDVPGALPLETVVEIAHRHGVPVLVDAAAQVYPIDRFLSFPKSGADLVCYSTKYFGGPNSTGILVGRKALIDAAVPQGFIGFETVTNRKGFGRPFKLDRQEIVAVVVAVEEWLTMDHERRLADYERRLQPIIRAIEKAPGLTLEILRRRGAAPLVLRVAIDPARARRDVPGVIAGLREGNPMVYVNRDAEAILVNPGPLQDGQEQVVADRLRALLA